MGLFAVPNNRLVHLDRSFLHQSSQSRSELEYFILSPAIWRYLLFGLTFWSGGHYRGVVLVNGVWHHYDGLWERNSRGQGLKKCTGKPSTPSGFLLIIVRNDRS